MAWLRAQPRIDPKRIYVLGHGLGGSALPLIGKNDAKIAGLVSLGGRARELGWALWEETHYLAQLSGDPPTPAAMSRLLALRDALLVARQSKLPATAPSSSLPLGLGVPFWLEQRRYKPHLAAAKLRLTVRTINKEKIRCAVLWAATFCR